MATFTSNKYDGRYMQLTITESVNVAANTSTLSWTLQSIGGAVSYYSTEATTVTINGTTVYSKAFTGWSSKVFPAAKGSTSGTITVAHNSDGKKSISVGFSTRVYYSGAQEYGGTMTLTNIDRTAPTVTHSTSNITANGFKISATSSVTADLWYYSTDGGSNYTQFSTASGTSASITLSNLSPNTSYSVRVKARKKSNQVYGYSTAAATKTLGGSVVTSASAVEIDVASPVLKFSLTVYDSSYYHKLNVKNGSTTIFSVNLGKYSAGTSQAKTYTLTSAQRTSMLNQIPKATSFTATIEVVTYSNSGYSTQIGSASSKTATMKTTSATSKPTFTAFTYSDSRSLTANATENDQVLLQSYSYLKIVATAGTAKNEASISSYSVAIGSVSKSFTSTTMNVGAISSSGSLTLKVTCIDSRGYSTSVSKTVKVLAYNKPKISSITLRRKDEIEDIIQLTFRGSFSAIKADGSTDTNSLYFAGYYYKRTDEKEWSSWVSIKDSVSVSGNNISFSTDQLMLSSSVALSLDPDYSWDFHLLIRDELNTLTSYDEYIVIPQGTPIVAIRKRNSSYDYPRVGINNPTPTAPLDVGGDIKMNGYRVLGFAAALDGTEDLNDLTSYGVWTQSLTASASTDKNYPKAIAGFLEVLTNPSGYVLQRYTAYNCSAMYVRYKYDNSWSAWKSITIS